MVEISTSILSVKKGEESSTFFELEAGKTDYFHIDVMDGKFVEKNTYKKMLEYASYIKRISNLPLDVHLMVENVKEAINDFLSVEPNIITFHLEACKSKEEVFEIIKYIKENNCKVGISIKPDTKIEEIYEFLPYIHMCLVMTVEPGKGGQTLIKDTLKKIEELKRYIENNNIEIDIEADGGINLATAPDVKKAGANILVSGTAILMANDFKVIIPGKVLSELLKVLNDDEESKVKIGVNKNQALFEMGKSILVSRIIEGEFLNYNTIIPDSYETKVKVKTKSLLDSFERVALFAKENKEKDRKAPLKMNIGIDGIVLSCISDAGDAKEGVQAIVEGKDIEIGFNPRYVIDILKVIDDSEIYVEFTSSISPVLIKPVNSKEYIYVVLPIKLRQN